MSGIIPAPFRRKVIFLSLICCFSLSPAFPASPGTSVFPFLKINPAARAAGMGKVNNLVSAQSLLVNPAVGVWLKGSELSFQHALYFSDVNYSLLTYAFPVGDAAIATSAGYLGVPGLPRTVADGSVDGYSEQGSFQYYDGLVGLGFSRRASPAFSYGISIKGVRESANGSGSSGVMVSLGGFYYPLFAYGGDYYHIDRDWQLGFGIINIGPKAGDFDLPGGGFIAVGKQIGVRMFWMGEVVGYLDQTAQLNTGFEYWMGDAFAVRAGYSNPVPDPGLGEFPVNLTAGVGFSSGYLSFDYAWEPNGNLGTSHRLTLTLRPGSKGERKLTFSGHEKKGISHIAR